MEKNTSVKVLAIAVSAVGILGLLSYGLATRDASEKTDGERWNEGLAYYEAGDVTNAWSVLKSLMCSSKTHGARAAEVVAALELSLTNREEAATAAQFALRAHPDDARANRNFTRVTDGLAEWRRERHVAGVLKATQGQDPGSLLRAAACEARALLDEAGTYRTNVASRAVEISDRLLKRAEKLGDVWIPVRAAIAQSVTNEEQAATIVSQLERAEQATRKATREFADLDGNAYGTMGGVERDVTRFLKMTILPPGAIDEDILAQTNAWQDVPAVNGRSWQQDALDYTRSFRAKFPAWARAYEQQAQADTNKPPFTAEDQAKVSALATEVEKLQLECVDRNLPADQEKALEMLTEIRGLLPKDSRGQGGGQGQPQANPQQNPDSKPEDDPKQDEQRQEDQPNPPPQEQASEKEQEAAEAKDEEKSEDDKKVEAILQKALERSAEHEREKKARMRKYTLPPNEEDW